MSGSRSSRIPRPIVEVLIAVWLACSAAGQTYTIKTFAGGVLPNNIPGTSASIDPWGVAVDAAGNVFIASGLSAVFRMDARTGVLTLVAGTVSSAFSGDGGPATNASLNPAGVAVDRAGNLYIADAGNHRVRKVSNGVIATVAGNGTPGFSGDSGPATSASLYFPNGIAVDGLGNLYIADSSNDRIRKISNGVITTVAGNGTRGFSGDSGPATSASLHFPNGIAVDGLGNLYIADTSNDRIRKISNGVIATVAGDGLNGFVDSGPATNATVQSPRGVAVDGGQYLHCGPLAHPQGLERRDRYRGRKCPSKFPSFVARRQRPGPRRIGESYSPLCRWVRQCLRGGSLTLPYPKNLERSDDYRGGRWR